MRGAQHGSTVKLCVLIVRMGKTNYITVPAGCIRVSVELESLDEAEIARELSHPCTLRRRDVRDAWTTLRHAATSG
jgi:hypothetical protein